MTQQVAIVGDGQMGLALADALAERRMKVRLWGPFPEDIETLASTRQSQRLREYMLPHVVEVTGQDSWILEGADYIFNAIPAQFVRRVWERLQPYVPPRTPIVSVTKGIEVETLLRPTQVIADVLGEDPDEGGRAMCALSGPTIATELVRRLPATMVAASREPSFAQVVQDLLNVAWLRIYRQDDLLGVELAGAMKNVIGLAGGMLDGVKAGDNAKSALLARGLAEIARLGTAMGANIDTFFGVAGVGDLATTCFSPSGRNRTCGERLGRGETLDEILAATVSVVEGVPTTKAVMQLARDHGVEMPITAAVHAVLFEGLVPQDAIRDLMRREQKAERIGQ